MSGELLEITESLPRLTLLHNCDTLRSLSFHLREEETLTKVHRQPSGIDCLPFPGCLHTTFLLHNVKLGSAHSNVVTMYILLFNKKGQYKLLWLYMATNSKILSTCISSPTGMNGSFLVWTWMSDGVAITSQAYIWAHAHTHTCTIMYEICTGSTSRQISHNVCVKYCIYCRYCTVCVSIASAETSVSIDL
jgi:hypothetical protein